MQPTASRCLDNLFPSQQLPHQPKQNPGSHVCCVLATRLLRQEGQEHGIGVHFAVVLGLVALQEAQSVCHPEGDSKPRPTPPLL